MAAANVNHQSRKTHCPEGHAYTVENTKIDYRGYRICRICFQKMRRQNKARKREILGLEAQVPRNFTNPKAAPEVMQEQTYKKTDLCRRCQLLGISCGKCRALTFGKIREQ